jgi:hypothetical protein
MSNRLSARSITANPRDTAQWNATLKASAGEARSGVLARAKAASGGLDMARSPRLGVKNDFQGEMPRGFVLSEELVRQTRVEALGARSRRSIE